MTTAALPRPVRVAVYTRKSVTDGLDQAFNSLHAQRQAIESYVDSQAGLGWTILGKHYDDGGFSGSNTERPAFQALLSDIEVGLVDIVAVYKIDRLSRSLRDFAKLIDFFERHDVTFVSVTQQFSTANSIGKLTLNILMSFAEFEREVISERIRDKMQATRRRGSWTGGRPVLGYDVVDKKLAVNPDEAAQVRATFQLYLERGNLREAVAELRRRCWTNKSFVGGRGQEVTGKAFSKASLHGLLTNVLYRGQIRCRDGAVPAVHEPIIDADLWDAVQDKLRANGTNASTVRNKTGAVLRDLVRCGRCGSAMVHTFSTRRTRRYRYYTCAKAHAEGAAACPDTRVAAGPFEQFVADQIRAIGSDEALLAKTAAAAERLADEQRDQLAAERRRLELRLRGDLDDEDRRLLEHRLANVTSEADAIGDGTVDTDRLRRAVEAFTPIWTQLFPAEQERILRLLIECITYDPDTRDVDIDLRPCGIEALATEAEKAP